MEGGAYQVIIIVVAIIALVRGYQKGLTGQICGLLGLAFGAVCSIVFCEPVADHLKDIVPSMVSYPFPPFVYSIVAASLIYTVVFITFRVFTRVLKRMMRVLHIGIIDRLVGAAFCLLKYLLFLSLIYNLILCVNPSSPLLKFSEAKDGNMVQSVLMIAPDLLGCVSVDDLTHALQLIEAKKISCNFNESHVVIKVKKSGEAQKII